MGYQRDAIRWRTRFGSWVGQVTVSAIVSGLSSDPELSVTRGAVYQWLRGHSPTATRARALVKLSEGRLSFDEIYSHREELKELAQCESTSGSTGRR